MNKLKLTLLSLSTLIICSLILLKVFVKFDTKKLPNLYNCFTTSIAKINLCKSNPNYLTIDQIGTPLIHAITISEDDKFFYHKGFDWKELKNSIKQNFKRKSFFRGASTITQQFVKNAYLHNKKSILRKIHEAQITDYLEKKYPKKLILEKYLNLIEVGHRIYGINKACQTYFFKDCYNVDYFEAAILATFLPNPRYFSKRYLEQDLSQGQQRKMKRIFKTLKARQLISEEDFELYSYALNNFNEILNNEAPEIN